MDPVTHTLVGVTVANGFLRRRIGPRAVPLLAVASNLPDIDALVHLGGDPAAILLRRSFGHSLVLVPVWSFLLALLARRFLPGRPRLQLFGLCLLGAALHVVFDLINSFGVLLLWPFSGWRPELAIVFIIDLILTGLLAAPWLASLPRRTRPARGLLSRAACGAVAIYLVVCFAARAAGASDLRRMLAAERGSPVEFSYLFPEPLGPHRWRGVVRREGRYDLFLIHEPAGRVEPRGAIATAADDPRVDAVRATPLGGGVARFFKAPVWSVEPGVASAVVSVYDLRFRSLVMRREPVFRFSFVVGDDGRVRDRTRFTLPDRTSSRNASTPDGRSGR